MLHYTDHIKFESFSVQLGALFYAMNHMDIASEIESKIHYKSITGHYLSQAINRSIPHNEDVLNKFRENGYRSFDELTYGWDEENIKSITANELNDWYNDQEQFINIILPIYLLLATHHFLKHYNDLPFYSSISINELLDESVNSAFMDILKGSRAASKFSLEHQDAKNLIGSSEFASTVEPFIRLVQSFDISAVKETMEEVQPKNGFINLSHFSKDIFHYLKLLQEIFKLKTNQINKLEKVSEN